MPVPIQNSDEALYRSVVEFISDLYFVFIFVGAKYEGKKFKKGVTCGVSIMRSGKSSFEMWQLAAHSLREHNYHYVHYSSLSLKIGRAHV